jgi:hypothetical protein
MDAALHPMKDDGGVSVNDNAAFSNAFVLELASGRPNSGNRQQDYGRNCF